MKKSRASTGSVERKLFKASAISRLSASLAAVGSAMHAESSSVSAETSALRFFARSLSNLSHAMLRQMRARNAKSASGRCGGMAFHAPRYVSLTHSSASSASGRMRPESVWSFAPYFSSVSCTALSLRAQ